MAERRMFAKTIIDSDAFLDMPLSAQALYFHLSMRADDEGFVNNPKKIQRMIGASDDDAKILFAKNFIIGFESGVIVIKHWKIHNYIRGDRMIKTQYKEERSLLDVKDNGAYTLNGDMVEEIPCQANVRQMSGTCPSNVRIGKDSIGKDSIGKYNNKTYYVQSEIERGSDFEQVFETVWKLYPVKRGKGQVSKTKKKVLAGIGVEELTRCIDRYMDYIHREHKEKYIMNGSTFFNSGYVDYLDKNYEDARLKENVFAEKIVEPELSDEEWAKMIERMD